MQHAIFYVIKKRTKIEYICICLICVKKQGKGKATLLTQWIRIRLSLQGTWVQILVWEGSAFHCRGHGFKFWSGKIPHASEKLSLVRHNFWAQAVGSVSPSEWAPVLQALKPVPLEPMLGNKKSHCNEKPVHCNEERPLFSATRESWSTAKKKMQYSQK